MLYKTLNILQGGAAKRLRFIADLLLSVPQ